MANKFHNIDEELFASRLVDYAFSTSDLDYCGLALGRSKTEGEFLSYLNARFSDLEVGNILDAARWAVEPQKS